MLKCKINERLRIEGRTSKWLANNLNVRQETVSKWANDKGRPSVEKLFKIADLLECKVDDLYEYKP